MSETRRRRRRTSYAWGEQKPPVYLIIGFLAVPLLLMAYLFVSPPDFVWRPAVKVPVGITPMPPAHEIDFSAPVAPTNVVLDPVTPNSSTNAPAIPDASTAQTNAVVEPIPAPQAVAPPPASHTEIPPAPSLPLLPQPASDSK